MNTDQFPDGEEREIEVAFVKSLGGFSVMTSFDPPAYEFSVHETPSGMRFIEGTSFLSALCQTIEAIDEHFTERFPA